MRRLALIVLIVLAAACGSSPKGTTGPGSTASTANTSSTTGTPDSCGFRSDTVKSKTTTVELDAGGAASQATVLTPEVQQPLACGSVRARLGGAADVTFTSSSNTTIAACRFLQDPAAPDKTVDAVMRTRQPDGALLHIDNGQVVCTTTGNPHITLCGSGDIQPDGRTAQFGATCSADHTARIESFMGGLHVGIPGKIVSLDLNQQITLNPPRALVGPVVNQALMNQVQASALATQAPLLNFRFVIPPTATTSTTISRFRLPFPPITR